MIAVLLQETAAPGVAAVLQRETNFVMSAATLTEALIVARRHVILDAMEDLVSGLAIGIVALTHERALAAAEAYRRWGKGVHRARLNYGDCFAYALAREFACPLLYVGDDFARTDVKSALA